MERGKSASTRGKGKAQHFPSDLYVLGSKTTAGDTAKRPVPSVSGERKREAPPLPLVGGKKAKPLVGAATALGRPGTSSPTASSGLEPWEVQATDVEPSDLVDAVLENAHAGQDEKAASLICGGLKALKNSKWKPDTVLTVGLIYLAKLKPSLFSNDLVTQALSVMLKRDPQHNFKSKGNPTVAVLAANLLSRGYSDVKHWPAAFIKLYIEDAMGERVWVDQPECKGFVANLLTGFGTKLPSNNIKFLIPDIGTAPGMSRADSPLTISLDDEEDGNSNSVLETQVVPRFSKCSSSIEQIVLDMQANRRQTPESITRNYLKLLASAAGIIDVRVFVSSRLEMWLQNPKLVKPAQELMVSVCVNCSTHSAKDIQVIGSVAKIRLKTKALINFYLSCIRELIGAHPDNLFTLLKHTIYNELSNVRNPNNMAVIGLLFQVQPDESASLLADVFLELLINKDDFLRSLRSLLREIVRVLRHDMNLQAFCRGLMADKRDLPAFKDFELKERMFCAIIDIITNSCFLGVSPAVKDSANLMARGDKRDVQTLTNFREMVATIQQETVLWLMNLAMKIYKPSAMEYLHVLHKVAFLEPQETYSKVDMWPPDSERNVIFRLVAESPVYEATLLSFLYIGLSKENPFSAADALDVLDQLIRRSASLESADGLPKLSVKRTDFIDIVLKVVAYHHPDNISLPHGYTPPELAVTNSYWKAWILLLIVCAHSPASLGTCAWSKYPTLRMFMEMCITNHFAYPPPTMQIPESADSDKPQDGQLTQQEREQILEFERYLAAGSSKAAITESTSLLLPQLLPMDTHGPARKPPQAVLDQLAALNTSHRLGHLLCRSRHPDFLLDLIQRQGASQSMPWLADLVENSEGSLSHLPLQCLCEFLLTSGPVEQQSKGQQLVAHLQQVLTSKEQDPIAPCEIMEYLLRRLSSHVMSSRNQAVKGLKLVLAISDEPENLPSYLQENAWLLTQLPKLPHFHSMRLQIVAALRQACQVENEPTYIASYIQFLAVHATNDDVNSMALLVQDMSQLIVERSTIMSAIVPDGNSKDALRTNTLHSLMLIFYSYLSMVRQPRGDNFQWTGSPDHVVVNWASGEEATLYVLVVHAVIILLSHGMGNDEELYERMLHMWFPQRGEQPRAYLADTHDEAILIPDWLKLRMIRSGVACLVDAALVDLAYQQLVLFIQSFGIPISSMSRLLETLDNANPELLLATNFDKSYMTQLVKVQQRRGATGGHKFLQHFGQQEPDIYPRSQKGTLPKKKLKQRLPGSKLSQSFPKFNLPMVSVLFNDIFTNTSPQQRAKACDDLQKILLVEGKPDEKLQGISIILQHLMTLGQNKASFSAHIRAIEEDPVTSCLVIRMLWMQMQQLPLSFQDEFVSYAMQVLRVVNTSDAALVTLLKSISSPTLAVKAESSRITPRVNSFASMLDGTRESIGQVIDRLVATEPELMGTGTENEVRLLLFGKPVKNETAGGVLEECRPYLLTLLTHRASWNRLHTLAEHLLSRFEPFYSPTAVLDFLEAMMGNPRLWQGREKKTPKHKSPEPVLVLSESHVLSLVEYIAAEAEGKSTVEFSASSPSVPADEARPVFVDVLETRLPLLLESLDEDYFPRIVKQMASNLDQISGIRSDIFKHFLVLLYFQVPGLIQYLGTEQEAILKNASVPGWSCSTLDKLSHTLLTAMMSCLPDSRDGKKSHEYEIAARKMATVHPALVLRQLPMLAASLMGRVHLDYHVLKTRNHTNVFSQVLGLMELLQPAIFAKDCREHFQLLLDAYLTIYKLHGQMKDVIHMLAKFVAFLQNYIIHDPNAATKFLQANSQALAAIQKRHPSLTSLRSLLSGVLTLREDNEEADGPQQSVVVTTTSELPSAPPNPILAVLSRGNSDELLPALQDLEHLSARHPQILEVVSETISDLLMSPYSAVRDIAHNLLARLLKFNPQCNALMGFMRCLESDEGDVVHSALEKLPEIVVSAQEHAVPLLGKAFSMTMRSNVAATPYISKALAMLNQQSGC